MNYKKNYRTSVALSVRISAVALWTSADWMMGSGGAHRLSGAWVLHKAGIYAALVDTGLGLGTVWVRRTFRPRRN